MPPYVLGELAVPAVVRENSFEEMSGIQSNIDVPDSFERQSAGAGSLPAVPALPLQTRNLVKPSLPGSNTVQRQIASPDSATTRSLSVGGNNAAQRYAAQRSEAEPTADAEAASSRIAITDNDGLWSRLHTIKQLHEKEQSYPVSAPTASVATRDKSSQQIIDGGAPRQAPTQPSVLQRSDTSDTTTRSDSLKGVPIAKVDITQPAPQQTLAGQVMEEALTGQVTEEDESVKSQTIASTQNQAMDRSSSVKMNQFTGAEVVGPSDTISDAKAHSRPISDVTNQRQASTERERENHQIQRQVEVESDGQVTSASSRSDSAQSEKSDPLDESLSLSATKNAQPAIVSIAEKTASTSVRTDTANVVPSLETVWPVSQTDFEIISERNVEEETVVDAPPSLASSDPTLHANIQRKLQSIQTQQATESAIDIMPPRRARPTKHSVPEQQSTSATASAPILRKDMSVNETATEQAPTAVNNSLDTRQQSASEQVVDTEIGSLPADLWELVGKPVPQFAASHPASIATVPTEESSSSPDHQIVPFVQKKKRRKNTD